MVTVSNIAFVGAFGAIILGGTGFIKFKHAMYIGVALLGVGLVTKPGDVNNLT